MKGGRMGDQRGGKKMLCDTQVTREWYYGTQKNFTLALVQSLDLAFQSHINDPYIRFRLIMLICIHLFNFLV